MKCVSHCVIHVDVFQQLRDGLLTTDGLLTVFFGPQILTSISKSVSKVWGVFIRLGVEQSSNWALKSLFEGPKWRPGCDFGTQGCFLRSGGFAERFFHPL